MLAIERKNQILTILQDEKKVVVAELSAKFGVSEETIRRDLEKLEKEGYVVKAYGGAVLNENAQKDLPSMVRRKTNIVGKQRIAELISAYQGRRFHYAGRIFHGALYRAEDQR